MKSAIVSLVLLLALNVNAKDAHSGHKGHKEGGDGHTPDACSAADAKVCAHIGHMTGMKSKSDSSFKVHVTVEKPVTNFKMDLWMPEHGHGTNSPVVIAKDKGNKYDITKAVFSMPGNWVARVSFDLDKTTHKIEIPLTIEK